MNETYDAIVIGSGIGGLTAGAFLARSGMKVLVLEQHTAIGGYAHSFKRRSFSFESGIHSVSMAPHGLVMHLMRLLGADNEITPLPQDEMFRFSMPGFSYVVPARREDFVAKLKADFPHEAENLDRLLLAMASMYEAMVLRVYKMEKEYIEEDRVFASRFINLSYAQFISNFIGDERLKSVFYGQWPYGGVAPDSAPAIFYSIMFFVHYLEGSHYCRGGFASLAEALSGVIAGHGGTVSTKSRVVRIECTDGEVRAVHCGNGESFQARVVVSNISPYTLQGELIDVEARSRMVVRRLGNLRPSVSAISVYCGLDRPSSYFAEGAISFWFNDRLDAIHRNISVGNLESRDHLIMLRAAETENRTLQLIYFAHARASNDWHATKARMADWMVARADELMPGLRNALVVTEPASPSTFERYTGNTGGAFYGFENAKDIYSEAKLPSTTSLKNLYQVGHWGKPGGGVWNVMFNGYCASRLILRNHG